LVKDLTSEVICNKVRALEDKSFRERVVNQGLEFSKEFTWEEKARQLFNFYKYVYENID